MILGIKVVRGVPELARGTLGRMGKKTKKASPKKSAAGKHAACGAELQRGATFCWHCKAPFKAAKKK